MLNPFFLNGSRTEQGLMQDLINESIRMYGVDVYYLPPMEAVSRVEMVSGAASLQFGSQFGGLVNYVLKEAPKNKKCSNNCRKNICR
jgi:Fe(3+) dicitrate transport protein